MDRSLGGPRVGARKQLLAEEVFHHVADAIVSGELAPGQRIRDVELAAQLHVSRMPVREALQRLERIGLVTMYPSRYTEVSPVLPEDVEMAREFAAFQSGFVARLAAERMTPEERQQAEQLAEAVILAVDEDPLSASRTRRELFSFLSAVSRNPLQHRLLDEADVVLYRNLRDLTETAEVRARMLVSARALRRALSTGDAAAAEHAARAVHGIGEITPDDEPQPTP